MELCSGKDLEVIQLHFPTKKNNNKSELYPRPQLPLDVECWTNQSSSLCTHQLTLCKISTYSKLLRKIVVMTKAAYFFFFIKSVYFYQGSNTNNDRHLFCNRDFSLSWRLSSMVTTFTLKWIWCFVYPTLRQLICVKFIITSFKRNGKYFISIN